MAVFKCHARTSIVSGSAAALWASLGGPITCMGTSRAQALAQQHARKTFTSSGTLGTVVGT